MKSRHIVIIGVGALAVFIGAFVQIRTSNYGESTGRVQTTDPIPPPPTQTATTLEAAGGGSVELSTTTVVSREEWRAWFPVTVLMKIGEVVVETSVADTEAARMQGLSDTPYIPDQVVKLFVFDTTDRHAFWMKDMNYPIDIIWVDEAFTVVHVESSVDPSTYPNSFAPALPARYVIETRAGFTEAYGITVGTPVELPS